MNAASSNKDNNVLVDSIAAVALVVIPVMSLSFGYKGSRIGYCWRPIVVNYLYLRTGCNHFSTSLSDIPLRFA